MYEHIIDNIKLYASKYFHNATHLRRVLNDPSELLQSEERQLLFAMIAHDYGLVDPVFISDNKERIYDGLEYENGIVIISEIDANRRFEEGAYQFKKVLSYYTYYKQRKPVFMCLKMGAHFTTIAILPLPTSDKVSCQYRYIDSMRYNEGELVGLPNRLHQLLQSELENVFDNVSVAQVNYERQQYDSSLGDITHYNASGFYNIYYMVAMLISGINVNLSQMESMLLKPSTSNGHTNVAINPINIRNEIKPHYFPILCKIYNAYAEQKGDLELLDDNEMTCTWVESELGLVSMFAAHAESDSDDTEDGQDEGDTDVDKEPDVDD